MSVIILPSDLKISSQPWEQVRNDVEFRSIFGAQALEAAPPLWATTLVSTAVKDNESACGSWQAMLMQLRGRTNQIAVHNFGRPQPLGTMRGIMTLNAAAAQGATTLSVIASGENSKTLLKGDMIGVGSGITKQVVMVVADATSNGSGVISVTTEPALRNAHSSGAAVVWDKPTALFRMRESSSKWEYNPGLKVTGLMLNLIEDWRA